MTVPAFVITGAPAAIIILVVLALIVLGIVSFFRMSARGARRLAGGRTTGTERHARDVGRSALCAGLDPEAVLERTLEAGIQRVQPVQRQRLDRREPAAGRTRRTVMGQ
jgi:hypothetical protein